MCQVLAEYLAMAIQTLTSDGTRWTTSGKVLGDGECLPIHPGCSFTVFDGKVKSSVTGSIGLKMRPKQFKGKAVVVRT